MKKQNTGTKLQINLKFEISMTETKSCNLQIWDLYINGKSTVWNSDIWSLDIICDL